MYLDASLVTPSAPPPGPPRNIAELDLLVVAHCVDLELDSSGRVARSPARLRIGGGTQTGFQKAAPTHSDTQAEGIITYAGQWQEQAQRVSLSTTRRVIGPTVPLRTLTQAHSPPL